MATHRIFQPLTGPGRIATARACLLLTLGLGGALMGCEEQGVQAYQTPKAPAYLPPAPIGTASTAQAGPGETQPAAVGWDVPQGWVADPNPSAMAVAIFQVPDPRGEVRVSVTSLSGQAGGILDNINRWRAQVGLGPIEAIQNQPMTQIQTPQFLAGLLDLALPKSNEGEAPGPAARFERILILMIPRQEEDRTWFFKMTGPGEAVGEHKQDFVGFVESVRFDGGAS